MLKRPMRFIGMWDDIKNILGLNQPEPIIKNDILWGYQESELLERINKYRADNNRLPLKKDDLHYRLANERVLECMEAGEASHYKFLNVAGVLYDLNFRSSSENLVKGVEYISQTFCKWKDSAKDNKNLLGDWKYTGICIKRDKEGVLYACQLFSK